MLTWWNGTLSSLNDWWNSERGRRAVKWATSTVSLLIAGGNLKLDAPIPYLNVSFGTLLLILGLNIPSAPPAAKNSDPPPPLRMPVP